MQRSDGVKEKFKHREEKIFSKQPIPRGIKERWRGLEVRKKQKMMENIKDDEKIKDDGKRKTTKMEKIEKIRHVVKQMRGKKGRERTRICDDKDRNKRNAQTMDSNQKLRGSLK